MKRHLKSIVGGIGSGIVALWVIVFVVSLAAIALGFVVWIAASLWRAVF